MQHKVIFNFLILFFLSFIYLSSTGQKVPEKQDTFFLAKKKGLLGRLGKSLSISPPDIIPQKVENQFLKFKGKVIRYIDQVNLGFESNINDTFKVKRNLGTKIARILHKNSREKTISNNLFFREGDKLYPYLLADNERYLRQLVYLQDARILVNYVENSTDSIDVVVLTKDIFSIGGSLNINNIKTSNAELSDENFDGTGSKLLFGTSFDADRRPQMGLNAEFIKRNIAGSFIDWSTGFHNFNTAFASQQNEETAIFSKLEKPLVTPYIPSTGSIELAFHQAKNEYLMNYSDTTYNKYFRYSYFDLDGWCGYSLDSKRMIYANKEIRLHRFIAVRGFTHRFITMPDTAKITFDYRFSDFIGTLASLNIFKQTFYKTNYIYGFGRNEDIPEGFNTVFTFGFANKNDEKRPYAGIDYQFAKLGKRGNYSNYTFRVGGFYYQQRFEDVDLLFNLDKFTHLKRIGSHWYQRYFISTGISAEVNPKLNTPLFLNSVYGLPYFDNGLVSADMRATLKAESVFYNTKKILGFGLAPFVFGDFSLLKPSKANIEKSELYSAVGAGIRSRNENLVFGTIELKAYFFPRTNGDMTPWRIELNSGLRFKYKSSFISRPDFIIAN